MSRPLIITVFFGPLPAHFPLWLRSATHNPEFDFRVITDQTAPPQLPLNVSFAASSLELVRAELSRRTGVAAALDRPYKLCDFKPLYWMLVPGIEDWSHWGFCDVDLLFGDLSPLLGLLPHYESILSEGHLRLFRNTTAMRELYREVPDWRLALQTSAIAGFDEHLGINRVLARRYSWFADARMIADIDPAFRQFRNQPYFRNDRLQAFFWHDGKVYREFRRGGTYGREEVLYIHFQKRAMPMAAGVETAEAIDIGPSGFAPRDNTRIDAATIAARNPPHVPNLLELRSHLREVRRRIARRPAPLPIVDRPEAGGAA